ncbi:MAG: fused response regulator/phosphatase [Gammaproteobacteria bacterium]|nr:MAG: fused response regulator/phosphatase [Gammaproteobacteria bacterium]
MLILAVDDSRANRTLLEEYLSEEGHQVITADSGFEAVAKFTEFNPDLIIMDVVMPGMDGLVATQMIKSKCGDRFVPIIFLTSLEGNDIIAKCIKAGGDDFLPKNYNNGAILAKITAMDRIRTLHEKMHAQKAALKIAQKKDLHELQIAEHVFSTILSNGDLDSPMINYRILPVSLFSGDLLLCAHTPSGGFHAILGDFTGHGLSAAIGAIPTSDIFYSMTEKGFSIGDIAAELNSRLYRMLPLGMFCAASFIEIDNARTSINIWNGGMPDVLIIDADGAIRQSVTSNNMALSVLPPDQFVRSTERVKIYDGDKVYMFSDGLTESKDAKGVKFGMDRLFGVLNSVSTNESLLNEILQAVDDYSKDGEQTDDVSLVEISLSKESSLQVNQPANRKNLMAPSTWNISLTLKADTLKAVNPVPMLLNLVMGVQAPEGHREHIFTILSELFSNALDHGLLGLDSSIKSSAAGFMKYYMFKETRLESLTEGEINILLKHQPDEDNKGGRLTLKVKDTGPGFDFSARLNNTIIENTALSGRGIALISSLCESLLYKGNGNQVEAIYHWTR